jgi:ADP-heptose:LPS heptosyltransferase
MMVKRCCKDRAAGWLNAHSPHGWDGGILDGVLHRNCLIFHQAALGDFIVTWPLAMALSRIMPQSRIVYVTHSQKGALAERVLRVESADAEAGWHLLLVPPPEAPQLPERAGRLLEGAHTVISFTAGQQDALAEGIKRAAPHVDVISLDTRKPSRSSHVCESIMDQLGHRPAVAAAMQQMLRSIESRGCGFTVAPKDRILIHPGAGKEANRWPAERFLELVGSFRDVGRSVRILLGEAELERWPASLVADFEKIAEVARPQTLLALLEELSAANLYIGNDSGPGHLAGIIGVPTLALFGPTDPVRWKPLGPRVRIIHSDPITEIQSRQVYTEALALLGG